jgi:carbon storage regulator
MLVLSRKLGESIIIDGNIRIKVLMIRGNRVRLGIEAPDRIPILRESDRRDHRARMGRRSDARPWRGVEGGGQDEAAGREGC